MQLRPFKKLNLNQKTKIPPVWSLMKYFTAPETIKTGINTKPSNVTSIHINPLA